MSTELFPGGEAGELEREERGRGYQDNDTPSRAASPNGTHRVVHKRKRICNFSKLQQPEAGS
jgi:hypothetical protein